ncbi:hypothetical protein RJ55_00303 [Drechmeria coniospora]|nr:hypothetical protein RJ55_00303 [Drechmeria coniospora]
MGSTLDKNSSSVRKRIENHTFEDEDGEEYEGSEFHGFGDYFRRKKIKLQNLDAELRASSDKAQIFKGIVAHITGYTQPPLHILHREIVQHGGGFLQYLDGKTMATHIIASTLPPKKSVEFHRYRIVKPAWIMDSVQAGKLLPWAEYRVLDEGPRQKVLKFDGRQGLTQTSPELKQGYREQTDNSFYTSQIKSAASASLPGQDLSQVAVKLPSSEPLKTPDGTTGFHGAPVEGTETAAETTSSNGESAHVAAEASTTSKVPTSDKSPTGPAKALKIMTSEEHNAWLLSDPRLRKSSTANPDFLKQFYSESRLHHLSTWKASLKSSMQRLAASKGLLQQKSKKRPGARSYVMHVDFDSFFCAVSLKKNPQYVDMPTVVAHSSGPGSEIASSNYPAREFGVKNGMWMKSALELCPELKVLPYDFPAYEEASRLFYESIMDAGGVVQSVSIDEALLDVTAVVLAASGSQGLDVDEDSIRGEHEKVDEMARKLRETIKAKTGCDVSIGIGANILQAKVALRRAKPAGQFHLKAEQVMEVIGLLKVESLPGVSYNLRGKLEEIGIVFVKDISGVSREHLASVLGPKTSEKLANYARGIDPTEVGEQPPRKSVSAEVSWGIRFISQPEAEEFVYNLCKELEKRLVNEQVKGRQLTVKIMRRSLDAPLDPAKHLGHGKCDSFSKSATFGIATHNFEVIGKEAVAILRSFKFSPGDLRGLGVQMTKLEPVKSLGNGPESSQKTLSFAAFAGPSPAKRPSRADPIDDMDSPRKARDPDSRGIDKDPIAEDPLTPRKGKCHPAMALSKAGEIDSKANTPLNVSGTQFIIPSNPDASVIAELPHDIRSRLVGQRPKSEPFKARKHGEVGTDQELLPSQVDAEVFNALPDEMKAEVLATYGQRPRSSASPAKDRQGAARKQTTPTKRGRVQGLFSKGQRQRDAQAGVVQTNFISVKAVDGEIEELDADFLAELPEDVRREVMDDHRRRQLARRSGLDAPVRKHQATDTDAYLPGGQRRIQFPAPPRKVPFAGSGLTATREIKDMVSAWHGEAQDEGPHDGDVDVFGDYLAQVVLEERDLEKAACLVRWLDALVERDGTEGRGRASWRRATARVRGTVQEAVKQRGLAPLDM